MAHRRFPHTNFMMGDRNRQRFILYYRSVGPALLMSSGGNVQPAPKRLRPPRAPIARFQVLEHCVATAPGWSLLAPVLEPLMQTVVPPTSALDSRPHVTFACPCLSLRGKQPILLKKREHINLHFNSIDHQTCTHTNMLTFSLLTSPL